MKVGDMVRAIPGRGEAWLKGWIHIIVGPGPGDWDWELYHAGDEYREPFTWYAAEEELELIE